MRFLERSAGVLLHITSLPSQFGVGDLGPEAYRFAATISEMGQRYWQMLPITATDAGSGYSPYSSPSAYAGNYLLINPEMLCEQGLIPKKVIASPPAFPNNFVDFPSVSKWKSEVFHAAFATFQKDKKHFSANFERFFEKHRFWLENYSLFAAIKSHFGGKPWCEWPVDLRDRTPKNLDIARGSLRERIDYATFLQFIFFEQWDKFKLKCDELNIRLIGDMPIYASYDSADVWAQPSQYLLDPNKKPLSVAGVPPDYFSKTGQKWGNPLYNWNALKKDGFSWWMKRLQHSLNLFSLVRIDHFRGLQAYWSIPVDDETAENGEWRIAPADDFLRTTARYFPALPLIAEDLGIITPDVRELLMKYDLPGMKVLQFAFNENIAGNPYAPHNLSEHSVLYTGTHDNNTTRGWYAKETSAEQRSLIELYAGAKISEKDAHKHFIRIALCAPSKIVIIPVQDIFGLDSSARMNTPGVAKGNWIWRMTDDYTDKYAENWEYLRTLANLFGRN